MSIEQDIVKAKENLRNALGDRFNEYFKFIYLPKTNVQNSIFFFLKATCKA